MKKNYGSKKRVFVAMSGGVDSSVAAALLKERGFDVVGVHIKMWSDPSIPCNFKEDRYDAMAAAEKIGIPFQTWDFTQEYRAAVVEYMIREYAAGRTPNPDVMCNRHIKFGVFLRRALELGADYVATGHYVRIKTTKNPLKNRVFRGFHKIDRYPPSQVFPLYSYKRKISTGAADLRGVAPRRIFLTREISDRPGPTAYSLYQAADKNKDQSYFLWTLGQDQLHHCLFPIGEYTKPEVREMARKFALPTAEKKDSQGICFIGEIDLKAFLEKYIPLQRGAVVTTAGKTVGEHEGLAFYTIGQREGLGTGGGGGIAHYVAGKNFQTNTLVVAEGPYDEKLFTREILVSDVNWISGALPKLPLRCKARIRYRQPLQEARIMKRKLGIMDDKKIKDSSLIPDSLFFIRFSEPQRAATPGQSAVFYKKGKILGGGVII
ncbi:MAG: tRNA-specific 2-thiouridylase [Candidatus Sungbacteria bacterium]|uniref:tRNA-specific 2-thiouridylase MnmA n=1 Tax=Candidatus Sungiibacteriota bacterium TaxID=2750080 RepID=A0A932QYI8_9BACT|nr:tRNA-specific 2-thiouridylase [Candidatus Sungbacteria bacterium]